MLEAVEDAAGAEIGGAGRPDTADGRGGEECDDGLGDVGQIAADPVPRSHAEGTEFGGERAHLAAEFGPADGLLFGRLVHTQERGCVGAFVGGAQCVFGVVEAAAGEPGSAGHRGIGEHRLVRSREADSRPLGEGAPEGLQLAD